MGEMGEAVRRDLEQDVLRVLQHPRAPRSALELAERLVPDDVDLIERAEPTALHVGDELLVRREEQEVVARAEQTPASTRELAQSTTGVGRVAERLLDEHVGAGLEREAGRRLVQVRRREHVHGVEIPALQHRLDRRVRAGDPMGRREPLRTAGADVADRLHDRARHRAHGIEVVVGDVSDADEADADGTGR